MTSLFRPSAALSCVAALLLSAAAATDAWAQGTGTGLQADYHDNLNVAGTATVGPPDVVRFENIYFNYGPGGTFPNPPAVVQPTIVGFPPPLGGDRNFVRWRGLIEPPTSGIYTFYLISDDNASLTINNNQLLAFGTSASSPRTITLPMTQGIKLPILVEYFEQSGDAKISLEWSCVAGTPTPLAREIVPVDRLYPISPIATPTITPNGGPIAAGSLVTLACATPNSTIYYTLDGSDPGSMVPGANAILYTGPFAMNAQGRVRVRAYATNFLPIEVLSNAFSPLFPPTSLAQPTNTTNGVYYQYYHNNGNWTTALPNFDRLVPFQRGIQANFTLLATPTPRDRVDLFGVRYSGYLQVTNPGIYEFQLDSEDGSKLFIGPVAVVSFDGDRNAAVAAQTGAIALDVGFHPVTVIHMHNTGTEALSVGYKAPGDLAFAPIPNSLLWTENLAATPIITTNATFAAPHNVQITFAAGAGTTLYYSLNDLVGPDARTFTGSATTSPLNFTLADPATIKAVVYSTGSNPSVVAASTVVAGVGTGPRIKSVVAGGPAANDHDVIVVFDRAMSVAGLQNAANFTVDGVAVAAATPLMKTGSQKGFWPIETVVGPPAQTPNDDLSGNGGTITFLNGLTTVADSPGAFAGTQCLLFDGTDDYGTIPDSPALRLGPSLQAPATGSFTVSLWIKPLDFTLAHRVINKWNVDGAAAGSARGWLIDTTVSGGVRVFLRQDGSQFIDFSTATGVLNLGAWNHIAARIDRQSNQLTVFVNGTLTGGTQNFSTALLNLSNNKPVTLGRLNNNAAPPAASGSHFLGRMDEIRIYNVALSDSEIIALQLGDTQLSSAVRLTKSGAAMVSATPTYALAVAPGLTDRGGVVMDPTVSSKTFRFVDPGTVTREGYRTDIEGMTIAASSTRVADLVRSSIYPDNFFDFSQPAGPIVGNNSIDNFGQRFRGYFIPASSGSFRFAIASDDNGQFWLSGDEDPTNKVMISHVQVAAGQNDYADTDVAQSYDVALNVGQKYYFEALYREGTGNDNFAAAGISVTAGDTTTFIPLGTANNLPGALGTFVPYIETTSVSQNPTSRTVLEGEPVIFTVLAAGTAPRTYQWQFQPPAGAFANTGGAVTTSAGTKFAIANASAANAGNYRVVISDGVNTVASAPAALNVTALTPTLTGIDIFPVSALLTPPPTGPTAGNQWVKLSGSGLISPWITATLGGSALSNITLSPDGLTLSAVTPAHAAGTVDLILTYPTGQTIPLAGAYTYYGPPVGIAINSVAPDTNGPNGPIAGGQPLVITGTNFIPGQTSVLINGFAATPFTVVNSTTINVTTPSASAGTGAVNVVITTPYGTHTMTNAYKYYDPPTILNLSKTETTTAATAISITGSNFATTALTKISFGAAGAGTSVGVVNSGLLNVTSPVSPAPTVPTTVQVSVTTPGGTTSTLSFTYYPPITVTSMDIPEGQNGGSDTRIINGTNFSTTLTANIVNFGPGNPATVIGATPTQLTVTTPSGGGVSPTAVTVSVTSTGTGTGNTTFTYFPTPIISSVNFPAGKAGDSVIVNGSFFSTLGTQTTVSFNGVNGFITNKTSSALTVTVPAGGGASIVTVPVVVDSSGGPSSPASFDYYPPPTLDVTTPISPTSGTSMGGNTIALKGNFFRNGQTIVLVDGVQVALTSVTLTDITYTAPAHDAATGVTIQIQAPGGNISTSYDYVGPRITLVNPNAGPSTGNQPIVISGSGFTPGPTFVFIGGTQATITNTSATSLSVQTPSGTAGPAVDVVVTSSLGTATLTGGFTYVNPVTIGTIMLNRGPVSGGQTVTITGTNFFANQTNVIFDTTTVTGNVSNSTTLTCVTPLHVAGTVNVGISTFGSPAVTANNAYTYVDPPTISSVSPLRGPTAGGQSVTIVGTNFEANPQTTVSFGGVIATANVTSPTTLTVATPAHPAAGFVPVIVRTFTPPQPSAAFGSTYEYVDSNSSVDLQLGMIVDNATPSVGGDVTFTLTVQNTGTPNATSVVVQDLLPAGLSFVSATPSAGTYAPGTGLWTVGTINAGASATLLLTAQVSLTSTIVNVAEIFGSTPSTDVDSTPNNGVPGEDDYASVPISAGLTVATGAGALTAATSGAPYYQVIRAAGGVLGYTWTVTSGTLPFDLDPATGVISGIAPQAAGNYTFTLTVSDSDGPPATASQTFSILVSAPAGGPPLIHTSPAPPAGTVGVAYYYQFSADVSAPPYTWSVSAGPLPGGLALNPATGELYGTPTAAGTFPVTIQATNGTPSSTGFSITISPNPVTFLTSSLANGSIGSIYDQPVQIAGGVGPTFTWSVASGTMPPGLSLTGTGRVATVTGTPSSGGAFTVTLKAQDNAAGGASAQRAFTITILATTAPFAPSSPATPPPGTLGQSYSLDLTGVGGTRPYTWTLAGGSLPTGLTFSGAAGTITGTPGAAGVFQITLNAHDSAVPQGTGSQTITITIAPAPVITTASPLPNATNGSPYFMPFSATGGVAPYTWSSTALPAGLSLSALSGVLSGIPTANGAANFDITITDANNAVATKSNVSLTVVDPLGALSIVSDLPPVSVGIPYSATIVPAGGTGPYTFSVLGSLPLWATFDAATGTLYGTPDATPLTFQIQVSDSALPTPTTILVSAPAITTALAITQTTVPAGSTGSAYATALTSTGGGVAPARVWTLTSGSLPSGLSLDPAGTISGVPQANGSFIFKVQVSDTQGGVAARQFSMTVGAGAPPSSGGGGGGGGGGGCGLLGAEVLLIWLWRRERRRNA